MANENDQYAESVIDDYDYDDDEYEGPVSYRTINPFAVTSLALGVLSFLTMFTWFLFVIPVAAIAFGWIALVQMTRRPGQYTGNNLAIAGILTAICPLDIGHGLCGFCGRRRSAHRLHPSDVYPDAAQPGK